MINFYIEKPIKTNLDKCLNDIKVDELKVIASNYKAQYKSTVKKAELIEMINEKILDKEVLTNMLAALCVTNDEFLKFVENKSIDLNNTTLKPIDYFSLRKIAVAFVYKYKGDLELIIPEEIMNILNTVNLEDLKDKFNRYSLVSRYISGFLNIYGIFEKEYFINVFNNQNSDLDKLTVDELEEIFKYISVFSCEGIDFNEYIAHEVLFVEEGEIEQLIDLTKDKEYYNASRDTILSYGGEFYMEETKHHDKLKKFIYKLCKNKDMADGIYEDICISLNEHDINANYLIYEFERRNLYFKSNKDISDLLGLAINVNNNTRKWINKGFMPSELVEEKEEKKEPINIGRNDPCICGSGKKYKKCCGKN